MKADLIHSYRIKVLAETEEEKEYVSLIKTLPTNTVFPKTILAYEENTLYFFFEDENKEFIKTKPFPSEQQES